MQFTKATVLALFSITTFVTAFPGEDLYAREADGYDLETREVEAQGLEARDIWARHVDSANSIADSVYAREILRRAPSDQQCRQYPCVDRTDCKASGCHGECARWSGAPRGAKRCRQG